jgi:hypothetical protein
MATVKGTKSIRAKASATSAEPYGDPMRDAIARGDLAEMKRLEATAVKWLDDAKTRFADVQSTLKRMRTAMKKVRR